MKEQLKIYEEKMDKTIDSLMNDYASIRAGRANPHVLDKIKVDYYGTPTPIQQVGNISVPEARMILIQPWEKSLLKAIEKAILTSDLGINPNNDGTVHPPDLPGADRGAARKELAKDVKKKGEDAKVAVRNIRRDANDTFKKMQKNDEISEDDLKDAEEKIQKMTDKVIEKIDKAVEEKTKGDPYSISSTESNSRGQGDLAPASFEIRVHRMLRTAGGKKWKKIIKDSCRMWRSSWMETAAGQKNGACPDSMGHKEGCETVEQIVEDAARLGIRYLTVYGFSTENWKRSGRGSGSADAAVPVLYETSFKDRQGQ